MLGRIGARLEGLSEEEKGEWSRFHLLKCNQLHRNNRCIELKLQIRILVVAGWQFKGTIMMSQWPMMKGRSRRW